MTTGRINQVTEIAEATTGDELPGLDWTGLAAATVAASK